MDLRRWGARFKENGARPYWEGHENSDVVESKQAFIKHFLDRKNHYYTANDNEEIACWIAPTKKSPSILICTIPSIFAVVSSLCLIHIHFSPRRVHRSGDIGNKRWFFGNQALFYSKGLGHSNMVSDFVVQHCSVPFFNLSPKEMQRALQKYLHLAAPTDLDYVERSDTARLHVGYDACMDNPAFLE